MNGRRLNRVRIHIACTSIVMIADVERRSYVNTTRMKLKNRSRKIGQRQGYWSFPFYDILRESYVTVEMDYQHCYSILISR